MAKNYPINKLSLTLSQVVPDELVIVTGIRPRYKYNQGVKTSETEGFTVDSVIPSLKYQELRIKYFGDEPPFDPTVLDENSTVYATPLDFSASIYRTNDGTYDLSCKCNGFELEIDPEQ